MWQCDYCGNINEYNISEGKNIICKTCELENKFLTRWVTSKILVIGANYTIDDSIFWSQVDENYIGIGDDYKSNNSTIFQDDWNKDGFWDQDIGINKTFNEIFVDYSVLYIFSKDIQLFKKLFHFIQIHTKSSSKLYFLYDDFNVIMKSYMKQIFIENLNPNHNYAYKSVTGNSKDDVDLLNVIISSGDWVVYDETLILKTTIKYKKRWSGLYKIYKNHI